MDLSAFEVGLKVIESACGPIPSFFIHPEKKRTVLSGTSAGSLATFNVPGILEGLEGPIEVQKDVFLSAIKGRKEGTVTLVDGQLVIVAGSYKTQVNVTDSREALAIGEPSEGQVFDMTPELHAYLSKTLPQLRIERVHSALPDVLVHLRLTAKQAFAVTFDPMQLCFLTGPNKTGTEFLATLPYTRFSSFIKDLPVANSRIVITPEAIFAFTKTFSVQIAVPVVDESSAASPDEVYEKAKEVSKVKTDTAVTLSKGEMELFLDNAKALVAVGTEVQFVPSKKGTTLIVDSPKGKVTLGLKTANKHEKFGLDYRFVQALLLKSTDELSFFIVDNTYVVSKANVVYVALLSAGDE